MTEREIPRTRRPEVINRRIKGGILFDNDSPVEPVLPTHIPSIEEVAAAVKRGTERLIKAEKQREMHGRKMRGQKNAKRKRENKPLIIG